MASKSNSKITTSTKGTKRISSRKKGNATKKASKNKNSKHYKKPYRGQGR